MWVNNLMLQKGLAIRRLQGDEASKVSTHTWSEVLAQTWKCRDQHLHLIFTKQPALAYNFIASFQFRITKHLKQCIQRTRYWSKQKDLDEAKTRFTISIFHGVSPCPTVHVTS